MFTFKSEQRFRKPLAGVFEFFADPNNLSRIVPPWMHFHVVRAPQVLVRGSTIEYRLAVHGLRLKWVSEITVWEPPHRFVDTQLHGPYRSWVHEHTFKEVDGETLAEDFVHYEVPGGRLVQRLLVEPDLKKIFQYRHDRLREIFGEP